MKTRNIIALSVFMFFYIAFGAYLTLSQERFVYHPWPQNFNDCPELEHAEKVVYMGTRMYIKQGERGVVVLYHGNAGSACDRAIYATVFENAGFGYALVEYAGYSNDTHLPSHARIQQDVRNVIAYLEEKKISPTVVVGESVGTGIASYHTSLSAPDALLLISPFTSLPAVAQKTFWFYPTSLLVHNAFDTVSLLHNYAGPITIVHGDVDTIIPYSLGVELYNSLATTQKTFVTVYGYGHNDILSSDIPFRSIRSLLQEVASDSE